MKFIQRYVIAALCILLAAAAGTIWYLNFRNNNYKRAAVAATMALENAYALNAETYQEADQWRQRAVQMEVERDSLARSLDERPVVETVVYVDPEPNETEAAEVLTFPDTVKLTFDDPVLSAEVLYRPAIPSALLRYDIKPMLFEFGVRCGPANQIGFRSVIVTLENTLPMDVDIQAARTDPEVCNANVLDDGGGGGFGWKSAALGVVTGFLGALLIS